MQFNIPAEHKNASGVYIIRNTVNDKVYVGSAVKLWKRYQSHCSSLRNNNHANRHLQAHCTKHGQDTLEMHMLELCSPTDLLDTEQQHLNRLNACNPAYGFNKVPNTRYNGSHLGNQATKGRKRGAQEIAKQVASRRAGAGYGMSEEQRQHQSKIRIGVKPLNAHTQDAQVKRIAARLANNGGQYNSLEAVAKSAATRTGSNRPDEVKAKISATMQGIERSPEHIAKQVASRRAGEGYRWTDEQREAASAKAKGRKLSWTPEQIAKRAATRKANNAAKKAAI